jgi:hypothetical protein
MSVCTWIYMHTRIQYVYDAPLRRQSHMSMYVYAYVCVHVCVYTRIHVYNMVHDAPLRMPSHVSMNVSMHAYMYVRVYTRINVYTQRTATHAVAFSDEYVPPTHCTKSP